ncbi:MAG: endolytic transglycosylase MltG, partial [Candidatus Margulisiibacteriota bacterium]
NKGLPPGPICNPGLKSILAAIHPAETNYIYFVSNGDGTHTFSVNWEGHAKAVQKFRKIK